LSKSPTALARTALASGPVPNGTGKNDGERSEIVEKLCVTGENDDGQRPSVQRCQREQR
ncbi:hypothetical protein U1Q18_044448, partial [Sarracenia purpurea var. burkii]